MVVMVEKLKHTVEEQEVHTVGASSSRRVGVISLARVVGVAIWCIG